MIRPKRLGMTLAHRAAILVYVAFQRPPKLVHQRADEPLLTGVEHGEQIRPAPCTVNLLVDSLK